MITKNPGADCNFMFYVISTNLPISPQYRDAQRQDELLAFNTRLCKQESPQKLLTRTVLKLKNVFSFCHSPLLKQNNCVSGRFILIFCNELSARQCVDSVDGELVNLVTRSDGVEKLINSHLSKMTQSILPPFGVL